MKKWTISKRASKTTPKPVLRRQCVDSRHIRLSFIVCAKGNSCLCPAVACGGLGGDTEEALIMPKTEQRHNGGTEPRQRAKDVEAGGLKRCMCEVRWDTPRCSRLSWQHVQREVHGQSAKWQTAYYVTDYIWKYSDLIINCYPFTNASSNSSNMLAEWGSLVHVWPLLPVIPHLSLPHCLYGAPLKK